MRRIILLILLIGSSYISAQEKSTGPIIKGYGEVYKVEKSDFRVDTDMEYKVVFDISESPESHIEINKSIETAARFLNMQAQSGVSVDKMKVALVIHGQAYKDILKNSAYQERFDTDNPNRKLVESLLSSGAQFIVCGQTAKAREISKIDMIPNIQMALSAMNALLKLQHKEQGFIKI